MEVRRQGPYQTNALQERIESRGLISSLARSLLIIDCRHHFGPSPLSAVRRRSDGAVGLFARQQDPRDPRELVGEHDRDQPKGLFFEQLPDPRGNRSRIVLRMPHDGRGADDEQ